VDEIYAIETELPYVSDGPFLPFWQSSPVIPTYSPYNWDGMLYSTLEDNFPSMNEKREVFVSRVQNLISPGMDAAALAQIDYLNGWYADFVDEGEDSKEPYTDILYPMIDSASDFVTLPQNSTTDNGKVVGVFAATFYWRDLFKNILPPGSSSIVVVVENTCGQSFAYQIDGPLAFFLGSGTLNDTKYEELQLSSELHDVYAFSNMNRTYSGLPLSTDYCPYTLRIYPSSVMGDRFATSDPIIFMVVTMAIFAFSSCVFMAYDYMGKKILMQSFRFLYL